MADLNWLTDRRYSLRYHQLLKKREKLPVHAYKQRFMDMLGKHRVLLVEAETGAGKTTQIPQWCLEFLHRSPEYQGKKWVKFKMIETRFSLIFNFFF